MAGDGVDKVKNFQGSLPPPLDTIWKFISVTISHACDLFGSAWDKVKESPSVMKAMEFIDKGVSAILPVVKNIVGYSVEKIKQHPWLFGLFGLIVLITFCLWKCCCCGSGSGRTMKAPGRDGRIFRQDFERNPRGYFKDLRGKSDGNRDWVV